MQIVKEKVTKKHILGIALKTSNEKGRAEREIPAHWNRFFTERIADKIPNKLNNTIFSLYTDYEGDFTKPYSCLIGYEVPELKNIPPGLTGRIIPEAEYALFLASGTFPTSVITTWQKIWTSPLKRAYTVDFEVYPPDFSTQINPKIKIYISLNAS
jgi:predicted transcriptional regulator YdeE